MKKVLTQFIILAITLYVSISFLTYIKSKIYNFENSKKNHSTVIVPPVIKVASSTVQNIAYRIDGQIFLLKNGRIDLESVPGTDTLDSLQIFGEPVYGDLNGDGIDDAALWLLNNSGGSGAFFYAVEAIKINDKFESTNAIFLGDRIAPQTLEIHEGKAVYNYAERRIDEPMTTQPSIGKSMWINYDKITGEISSSTSNTI